MIIKLETLSNPIMDPLEAADRLLSWSWEWVFNFLLETSSFVRSWKSKSEVRNILICLGETLITLSDQ